MLVNRPKDRPPVACSLAGKCARCCCIDVAQQSKEELEKIFRYRTKCFKKNLHWRGDITGYEKDINKREKLLNVRNQGEKLEKKCHYLGFIDDKETGVGCLAHPDMNFGNDLRDFGFYLSASTCTGSSCGAHKAYQRLTDYQKDEFAKLTKDWTWYEFSDEDKAYHAMGQAAEPKRTINDILGMFRRKKNDGQ